ncbi:hypothetical protein STANM309S_05415 [Streptomyces tanashiensis]
MRALVVFPHPRGPLNRYAIYLVVPQGLLQRVGDMLLPDDLGEGLGAIAAVQRERRHVYEVIGAHRQPGKNRSGGNVPAGARDRRGLVRHGRGAGRERFGSGTGTAWVRERKCPPRTCQSRPTLAAFRPWGSSVR